MHHQQRRVGMEQHLTGDRRIEHTCQDIPAIGTERYHVDMFVPHKLFDCQQQVAVGQHDGIDGREAARVAALGGRDGVGFEQDSRVAPVQEVVARAVVDAGGDLPSLHEENVASVGHAFDARIDGRPVGFQLRGREQLPVGADRFEHAVPLRSGVGVQRRGGRVHLVERVQAHRSLFGLRGGRTDRQDAGGEQGKDTWIHGVGRVKRGPGLPAPAVEHGR